MKIILSRKGFDSTSGGCPSPILPEGTLLSLPIPDDITDIKYSDLEIGTKTYFEVLVDLSKCCIQLENEKIPLISNPTCHFDPDIRKTTCKRSSNWKGLFGQTGAAQTHLSNQGVSVGDIFLFFGWFRNTINQNGKLEYDPKDKHGRHIIYGFLEVGEIIDLNKEDKLKNWMKYHPHNEYKKKGIKNNFLYVSSDHLSLNNSLNGYGTFSYNEELVLTKENETRTKWNLPDLFRDCSISYHKKTNWKEGYFRSVSRGQEFVVSEDSKVTKWAKDLIENNIEKHD